MITSKIAPFIKYNSTLENTTDCLIYEIIDKKPLYFKGYQDVISGEKKVGEITASNMLRSYILTNFTAKIFNSLADDLFTILTNTNLYLDKSNNLVGDILIFDNDVLKSESIDEHYADVPPKIAIEVDVTADTSDIGGVDTYVYKKVRKLLDFGVERVIWINTATKTILMADDNLESWIVQDWNKDIEILEGLIINIPAFLLKKKIVVK